MFTCDITKVCSFEHTLLTVNYCLFTHSGVFPIGSIGGGNDNVVLEYKLVQQPI